MVLRVRGRRDSGGTGLNWSAKAIRRLARSAWSPTSAKAVSTTPSAPGSVSAGIELSASVFWLSSVFCLLSSTYLLLATYYWLLTTGYLLLATSRSAPQPGCPTRSTNRRSSGRWRSPAGTSARTRCGCCARRFDSTRWWARRAAARVPRRRSREARPRS